MLGDWGATPFEEGKASFKDADSIDVNPFSEIRENDNHVEFRMGWLAGRSDYEAKLNGKNTQQCDAPDRQSRTEAPAVS